MATDLEERDSDDGASGNTCTGDSDTDDTGAFRFEDEFDDEMVSI